MAVYIEMFKEEETEHGVRYRAEMDIAGESYFSKSGKQRYHLAKKVGVFEFQFEAQALVFLPKRSDKEFLQSGAYQLRCFIKMLECQRAGQFPEKVIWAS